MDKGEIDVQGGLIAKNLEKKVRQLLLKFKKIKFKEEILIYI